MSTLAKFLLIATGFAPVLLTYALVSFANDETSHAVRFSIGCISLVLTCVALLRLLRCTLPERSFEMTSLQNADGDVFNFLLVYILPLISADLASYNWTAWLLVSVLFCFLVATSYSFQFNPLLVFLGYHFYKVSEDGGATHVLITRRRLRNSRERLKVARLAEYVLIEKDCSH